MRVPVGVKASVFALLIMGSYTYFANSIPQIESKPPQELSLEGGNVTPAQLVKAGEQVFQGKGGCIACHKAGKIGASPVGPDLSQIAKIQTPDYIMKKILDPRGMGTVAGFPPGVMPPTFGQTLTAKEYTDLVSFLLTLK